MKPIALTAWLAFALTASLSASETTGTPVLEFTSGLPGQQVQLSWAAQDGLRYRVEKSSALGTDGSGWSGVAIVKATGNTANWTDPEATTTRAFYRVTQPLIEVTSISPPLLSITGGTLEVHGQSIPAGSVLILEIDGQAPVSIPLTAAGNGIWEAIVAGNFAAGARVTAARIEDSAGGVLLDLDVPLEVTASGRASDSPPGLPPAAPRAGYGEGKDDDCDGDTDDISMGRTLSKRGYDYYSNKSDMSAASMNTNPYFQQNNMAGEMACIAPPGSPGLPGEVSFQTASISLPCPAGPPLAWVCTYRSMKPVSSGHGAGWDFSYNIAIEPLPAADGANAARLVIRDGGGRADTYHRQPDGSYRCDGMFREGTFSGTTFTLTFANQGTWTFNPLDGSPTAGKIAAITDRNGVALSCSYDTAGLLASVDDAFGRSLAVEWDSVSPPRVASVSSKQTGGAVFSKTTFTYSPSVRQMTAVSVPFVPGRAPVAGAMTFTYDTTASDPRLRDNLLSLTDGAGRLMEAFTYSTSSTPTDVSYDTCSSQNRHRIGTSGNVCRTSFAHLLDGKTTMTENDELGRVCETVLDRQHRVLTCREYTGFATPGVEVTATANRPTGKLRSTDPDFFETTRVYNVDSLPTSITCPDGSGELVTYQRDLKADCPVRERGNARVMTIRAPGGESRTVSCDYAPGFGTREPGHGLATGRRQHRPVSMGGGGILVPHDSASGMATGKRISEPQSGMATGRRQHKPVSMVSPPGTGGGVIAGIVVAGLNDGGGGDNDCDGVDDDCDGFVTRMTSSLGQVSTRTYDANGNCTAALSPLPGRGTLYQYNANGRCTSITVLNGAASSFVDGFIYDGDTGFLLSVVRDSTGLQLTTTCVRDAQGRVTGVTDPRGNDRLYAYDPLHRCIQASSPLAPARISTSFTYDAGNLLARCDTDHLAPDGSPVAANPVYTTFYVHDSRGRLVRVAAEERPVDATGVSDPATLGIENFAVRDIGYDAAGQCVSLSTPAACRGQGVDQDCDMTYDERGLLHRCIVGGVASPAPVIMECDYDTFGLLVRCATVANGVAGLQTTYAYDGFHRPVSVTDPMGNITSISYSNDGSVTCSVFGEMNDVPGSAGNVLLSRSTVRSNGIETGVDCGGGPAGLTLDSLVDACYSLPAGLSLPGVDVPCYGIGPSGLTLDGISDVCWDSTPSGLTLPGITDACYSFDTFTTTRKRVLVLKSNKRGDPAANKYDFSRSAFFGLQVEDDTSIVERFSPGQSSPHATETTIVDRSPAGLVQGVSRNGDVLLTRTYDSAGRVATSSNGACTAAITRDGNGNGTVCGKTDHFLSAPGSPPDKTFSVARVFDALDRCVQSTDGSGNVVHYAYDSLGRCVSITEAGGLEILTAYDGGTAAAPFSSEVSADVDGDGNPEVLSRALVRCGELVRTEDSYGHRTSFIRDSLGRETRCDYPDGTFQTWSFDALGRNLTWVCQNGATRTIVHDANNRPLQVSWTSPQGVAPSSPTTHQWDGLGRCVRSEQASSVVTCDYDSLGNPVSDTSDGNTVTRSFDHRGRTGITYPDGSSFVETRDALGQPLSVSAVDGATGTPVTPPVVTLEYAGQRVWRSTQANGVVTTCVFRGDGEAAQPGGNDSSFDACVRVSVRDAAANVLSDTALRRDANQRDVRCDTLFTASPQGPGRSQEFTRDVLGRVTRCITNRFGTPPVVESDVTYTLDLEGRRLTATGGNNPGSYTQSNTIPPGDQQMGQYSSWPGGPLTWDETGNLASISSAAGQLNFLHDAEGRLVAVTDPASGTAVMAYAYDALGRRAVRDDQTGKPVRFIYDGDTCIQEIGPDTNPDATFVCLGGIQRCISTRNGSIIYPHGGGVATAPHWGDPHENLTDWKTCPTTLVTNATGVPTERFAYDDAGTPIFLESDGAPSLRRSAIAPIRWLAPASIWEPNLGLFFGGDSIYNPALGMRISHHRGHVTVLKSPGGGGGHVTVLKACVRGGGHVTVLKAAESVQATDHNSSRSNKTSH